MELVKPYVDLIIDTQPDSNVDNYLSYFDKSLLFAQTNYHQRLNTLNKININTLTPTVFFTEYLWSLNYSEKSFIKLSKLFCNNINKKFLIIFEAFRNSNSYVNMDIIRDNISNICLSKQKSQFAIETFKIIKDGISLLYWEVYRDIFLSSPEKIKMLPGLDIRKATHLAKNIGIVSFYDDIFLNNLSKKFGFNNSYELCYELHKKFKFKISVIGLILWYSAVTFDNKKIY